MKTNREGEVILATKNVIESLCADIDLTKQICSIEHRKFCKKTKIRWCFDSDRDRALAAINEVLDIKSNIHNNDVAPLVTVGDAFYYIEILSNHIINLW